MSEPESESSFLSVLRQNVILIVVFIGALGIAVYKFSTPNVPDAAENTPAPDAPATAEAVTPGPPATTQATAHDISVAQQTMETIKEHQKKFDADPKSPDAPALLSAMGNLYARMGDYKEAARCYDLLIASYPDWPNIKPNYHYLAICYQKLGDRQNEQRIYKAMMNVFPPESQEYQYAKVQLGM